MPTRRAGLARVRCPGASDVCGVRASRPGDSGFRGLRSSRVRAGGFAAGRGPGAAAAVVELCAAGCGNRSRAATGSWTSRRSGGAWILPATCAARNPHPGPDPGTGTLAGRAHARDGRGDGRDAGVRGVRPPPRGSSWWPGQLPAGWEQWPATVRDSVMRTVIRGSGT